MFGDPSAADPLYTAHLATFRQLYGQDLLPDALTTLLNTNLAHWDVRVAVGTDTRVICGQLYFILYKLVLEVEEKPIITRFWLFRECVVALLRMKLLGLPSSVFSVGTVNPRRENQKI